MNASYQASLVNRHIRRFTGITVYLYLGTYLHQYYVLYVEWITFIFPGHWNIRYDSYSRKCGAISPTVRRATDIVTSGTA